MNQYSYKTLNVYQDAKKFVVDVYKLLKLFPSEEKYALCDQIRRAVISVPANIAEGMGRTSKKEQKHFLEIAYGSLMEVQCLLDISTDLGYISKDSYNSINTLIFRVATMINKLHSLRTE